MSTAEKTPEFADLYLQPLDEETAVARGRYRQSVRIGFVEMERIVEDVLTPEFEKIAEVLMDAGHDVELVIFDTESSVCDDFFLCGSGLNITCGEESLAIVYTGAPCHFEFTLQTLDPAGTLTELTVQYHKLNPYFLQRSVFHFLRTNFPEIDFSGLIHAADEEWSKMEGPFSVKVQEDDGFNTIAETATIEEAMKMASMFCTSFMLEDQLILEDCYGQRVG